MSESLFKELLKAISCGNTLRQWARDHRMHFSTAYDYINTSEDRIRRFAYAREMGFDFIAEETLEIADNAENDWMVRHGKDGEETGYQLNGEHVQRSKLRIETRLKLLAKWNPKKYGDRIDVNADITGEITQITRTIVKKK